MIYGFLATLTKSGEHVAADFIISATGLTMQHNFPFSTVKVTVDGNDYKVFHQLPDLGWVDLDLGSSSAGGPLL